MKLFLTISICGFLFISCSKDDKNSRPFPQSEHLTYSGIKPSKYSQTELDSIASNFYNYWKSKYLVESSAVPGDFKIDYNEEGWTVSEAMGYGMLITVQMAGNDPDAKKYFDGLNRFRKRYPSNKISAFMNWQIKEESEIADDDCATDGDLDMAMALLMAEQQWKNSIYKDEAIIIIDNIAEYLVRDDYTLRLGDWNSDTSSHHGTRPSDFTTSHFRSFYQATGDSIWLKVEDKCYSLLLNIHSTFSSETSLTPDFLVWNEENNWEPAPPFFLESKNDGKHYYNSSRVPWRMGVSATYHNDERAKRINRNLMRWVFENNPQVETFVAGYSLEGEPLSDYTTTVFTSPLIVAAMSTNNHKWLDEAFEFVKEQREDYFSDSVTMLALLSITNNFWYPEY